MWDVTPDVFFGTSPSTATKSHGQCIWIFDGTEWHLKSLQAKDGGVAGEPPSIPGRFKGQLRVTPCVAPALA